MRKFSAKQIRYLWAVGFFKSSPKHSGFVTQGSQLPDPKKYRRVDKVSKSTGTLSTSSDWNSLSDDERDQKLESHIRDVTLSSERHPDFANEQSRILSLPKKTRQKEQEYFDDLAIQWAKKKADFIVDACYNGSTPKTTSEISKILIDAAPGDKSQSRTEISVSSDFSPSSKMKKYINFSTNWLTAVRGSHTPPIDVELVGKDDRSYAFTDEKQIMMNPRDNVSLWVHEVAHILEAHNPRVKKLSREYLDKHFDTSTTEKLSDLSGSPLYAETEIAHPPRKGRELLDFYTGKVYDDGSTEVASMALERLYQNSNTLATHHPELFRLAVTLLHL